MKFLLFLIFLLNRLYLNAIFRYFIIYKFRRFWAFAWTFRSSLIVYLIFLFQIKLPGHSQWWTCDILVRNPFRLWRFFHFLIYLDFVFSDWTCKPTIRVSVARYGSLILFQNLTNPIQLPHYQPYQLLVRVFLVFNFPLSSGINAKTVFLH